MMPPARVLMAFYKTLSSICLLCFALGCGGGESNRVTDTAASFDQLKEERPGWTLVWADNFDGMAGQAPNPDYWTADIGGDGWGNQQLEYDTDRTDNAGLDGMGHLVITARREAYEGRNYTSARIKTAGKVEFTYGRIEARIQLPQGQGIWPAFWLLGANINEVSWPQCGEIDILEQRGQKPSIILGSLHGPGYSGGQPISGQTSVSGGTTDAFHVYAVEWTANEIRWSIDGYEFHAVKKNELGPTQPWVFDAPFFIILNVAVGGNFLGPPNQDTTFPQRMLVDYVRVYRAAK